jgi:TRAP-type uncharacterized transport system substrate-binding protein
MLRILALCALLIVPFAGLAPAMAQPTKPATAADGENAIRNRKNAWTVGVASGQLEGLYPRFAAEIAKVLDDGDNLRVLPFLAYGAASNVEDLLYLRGVDVAFTQSDVLEYYKTQLKVSNLQNRISYLMRLYTTEVHILAGPDVKTMEDLRGKKVSFGPPGNSAALTGPIIFQRLNIPIEQMLIDHSAGLEQLRKGQISAIVRVVGKPVDYFTKIPADSGLHFVPISGNKMFDDIYTFGELTSEDYPTLVQKGQSVDTVAVPTVLAVFNWPRNSERYARLQKFTDALFSKWDRFQQAPFHPKWREVNLAADVPGWTRSPLAVAALKNLAPEGEASDQKSFDTFLATAQGGKAISPAEREKLFKDFMSWRARQNAR